jgi:hypothetical protein
MLSPIHHRREVPYPYPERSRKVGRTAFATPLASFSQHTASGRRRRRFCIRAWLQPCRSASTRLHPERSVTFRRRKRSRAVEGPAGKSARARIVERLSKLGRVSPLLRHMGMEDPGGTLPASYYLYYLYAALGEPAALRIRISEPFRANETSSIS